MTKCDCDLNAPSCVDRREKQAALHRRQWEAEKARAAAHRCSVDDGTGCERCCEHGDTDERQCLDCGKDLLEDRMAAAYDYAKDRVKYGDC